MHFCGGFDDLLLYAALALTFFPRAMTWAGMRWRAIVRYGRGR